MNLTRLLSGWARLDFKIQKKNKKNIFKKIQKHEKNKNSDVKKQKNKISIRWSVCADQISVRNLKCRALDFSENFGGNLWKP